MKRNCERCGKEFVAQRNTARYCSSSCRSYVAQGVPAITPEASTHSHDTPGAQDVRLVDALRVELEDAGVQDSSDGIAALILARRIEAGSDPGAATASMAKQMQALRMSALASVSRADKMDEVTRARDKKLRSAGLA